MTAYYNEFDPYAAQWLRNLISKNLIAPGNVDERSIADVQPSDLEGYVQCHFFAGIGGWSHALRLAGWPDDRPAWTGSCPCQPFSPAGPQRGFADPRHLWPEFRRLIAECQPPAVFGEQVASATEWLRDVHSDLEAMGYAVGAIPIEAASAGAQQPRDRFWFVASAESVGRGQGTADGSGVFERNQAQGPTGRAAIRSGDDRAYANGADGKRRAVEPAIRLLAHGVPSRVGKLRAYGNAIVPTVAAEFIAAYLDLEAAA